MLLVGEQELERLAKERHWATMRAKAAVDAEQRLRRAVRGGLTL
jgi:hypothetical protein